MADCCWLDDGQSQMEPNEFIRLSNGWWKETDLLVGLLATNSDFQHSIGAIWRGIYVPMRSVKVEWKFLLFETDVFRKKKTPTEEKCTHMAKTSSLLFMETSEIREIYQRSYWNVKTFHTTHLHVLNLCHSELVDVAMLWSPLIMSN